MSARIPRLGEAELDPELARALAPRVARLGYLGEFFRVTAHQPDALRAFVAFTEAAKGGLPDRLVEVVALSIAGATRNRYERHQHERLCIRQGQSRDWVAAVNALAPHAAGPLRDDERAVQRLALALLRDAGHGVAAELEAVVDALGPASAVAVLLVAGRYLTHGLVVNALALEPPVPSIFEDGFGG